MRKFLEDAAVVANAPVTDTIWRLVCKAPQTAASALPGQFVNVLATGRRAFLRRPFGIAAADAGTGEVTVMYRLVGRGTADMAALRPGQDRISVEGPLGGGTFSIKPGKALLVGGGVGLAPLIFLAYKLDNPVVLIAGRTASETFWNEFFTAAAEKIYITTDDGSAGIRGFAAAAVPRILKENRIDRIAVCGPTAMMRTVAAAAAAAGIPCEVSMEKRMACGIGACLGCTFESGTDGKRYKVCADGPVFDSREVF